MNFDTYLDYFSVQLNHLATVKLHTGLFWISEIRIELAIFFLFLAIALYVINIIRYYFGSKGKKAAWEAHVAEQHLPHQDDMLHFFQAVNDVVDDTANPDDDDDDNNNSGAFVSDAVYEPTTGVVWCSKTPRAPSSAEPPPLDLVIELGQKFGGMDIGMGTCAMDSWFRSFWLRYDGDERDPLTEVDVHRAFGAAISPVAKVVVEPLVRGGGDWWLQVLSDSKGAPNEAELLQKWDDLMAWFDERVGTGAYFVRIDPEDGEDEEEGGAGFSERPRCAVVRVAGSIVGVLGCVVIQTAAAMAAEMEGVEDLDLTDGMKEFRARRDEKILQRAGLGEGQDGHDSGVSLRHRKVE